MIRIWHNWHSIKDQTILTLCSNPFLSFFLVSLVRHFHKGMGWSPEAFSSTISITSKYKKVEGPVSQAKSLTGPTGPPSSRVQSVEQSQVQNKWGGWWDPSNNTTGPQTTLETDLLTCFSQGSWSVGCWKCALCKCKCDTWSFQQIPGKCEDSH